jgi:hypothetical protein
MSFVVKLKPKQKSTKCKPKKFLPEECYPSENNIVGTIIPIHKLPLRIWVGLQFTKRSITEYVKLINYHYEHFKNTRKCKYSKLITKDLYSSILEKEEAFKFIIRTVTSLRRFVQQWLYKKYRSRNLNTEDPATLCVPAKPICIYDSKAKGVYNFEMLTIKQQFTTDLSYSDWMFPYARQPKNPFTNLPFTEGQIIYIVNYLKLQSMSNMFIEAYKQYKFNIKKFQEDMYTPLRLRALEDLIKNPSSEQFLELVYEFVEDHYNFHECICKSHLNIIHWAIKKRPSDVYIKKWIDMFYRFMRIEILHGKDYFDNNQSIGNKYYSETHKLLNENKELSRLGYLRLQSVPARLNRISIIGIAE